MGADDPVHEQQPQPIAVGLRPDLTESIWLQLEYARGLTRSVDDSGGDFQRVFFEFSKNF